MKAKHIYYILALFCAIPLQSCYIHNDEDFADNAEGNFEMLWKICDEYYCYFDYKDIDWDSIHTVYKPRIYNGMSNDELFKVCADMLAELKDGHVNLYYPYDNSRYWGWSENYPENYDERIVLENYFNFDYHRKSGFIYQKLPGTNIGYMHYDAFTSEFSDYLLNHILTEFKDCKGLIIDIRSNGGGSIANVNKLACRFTDKKKVLVGYELIKTGPGHNEFGDTITNYLDAKSIIGELENDNERVKFLKDVVVLTNRGVYSAANDFVRTMKVLDNVTIIGDRSGGGGGVPVSFELPNGWSVRLSTTPMLDSNWVHTEFGIDPTEGFKVDMDKDAHITGRDAILDRAIEYLSSK